MLVYEAFQMKSFIGGVARESIKANLGRDTRKCFGAYVKGGTFL